MTELRTQQHYVTSKSLLELLEYYMCEWKGGGVIDKRISVNFYLASKPNSTNDLKLLQMYTVKGLKA